jgi:hypothetical protein
MNIEYDNLHIKHIIEDTSPFFIGRIAGIELQIAYSVLKQRPLDMLQEIKFLENNAGIHIKNIDSLHTYVYLLCLRKDKHQALMVMKPNQNKLIQNHLELHFVPQLFLMNQLHEKICQE